MTQKSHLTLDHLIAAATAGGPVALTEVTNLAPAAGEHALIAPAKYASGNLGTYVYETRFIDGAETRTVLVDSRTSQANRVEEALAEAIRNGHGVLSKMPSIKVGYAFGDGTSQEYYDYELPHRAFDAHVRSGTVDGTPVVQYPAYRAARDANQSDASDLLALSPITLALGGWDSTRRSKQGRYAAAFSGEIIGVLADQDTDPRPTLRSGARIDPVAASMPLTKEAIASIVESQRETDAPALKKVPGKASDMVLGAIPPGTASLDGIATSQIIRSFVLSFATLRQLRFGGSPESDAAIRALLSAIVLNGMARANSELFLRANCHLVETADPEFLLDQRHGNKLDLAPLTIEAADDLLDAAFAHATTTAGLDWDGQVLSVDGHPEIAKLVGTAETTDQD